MSRDLEQAILDHPDDVEAFSVYADALVERGDPRGELIQIQLRLEDDSLDEDQRARLTQREGELLQAHGRTWLGPLAEPLLDAEDGPYDYCRYKFERGFLHTIDTYEMTVPLVMGLRGSDETRFLRRLVANETAYIEGEVTIDGETLDEDANILTYLPWDRLARLRELHLGTTDDDNTHANGEDLEPHLSQLTNLEVLELGLLRLEPPPIFSAPLSKLRRLLVYHVYRYELETLASNPAMSNLEELGCRPHGLEPDDEDPYIRLDGVRALTESPYLTKLCSLELRASDMGDEGVALLLDSGMVGRLKVLDLHYGEITDEGAERLADHPDTKQLERLDIGGNALTSAGLKRLADAGIAYVSDEQFELDDDREYLWYGCPE